MSSSFTSDEEISSLHGSGDGDFDKSFPFASPKNNIERKSKLVVDRSIAILNKCLQDYEEKARTCENQLESLGFPVKDLPDGVKSDLKEALNDDEGVFIFPRSSSEMVRINADHVLGSLQEKYELETRQVMSSLMETLVEEYSRLLNNLERKLNNDKLESESLENKRFHKEANLMIFKEKLSAASWELKNLQQLSKGNKKPKYSLDELEDLKQEVNKLKTDIAFTKSKLNKYNKLPLREKDAEKELVKMKDDLKKVDNEIRNKVGC